MTTKDVTCSDGLDSSANAEKKPAIVEAYARLHNLSKAACAVGLDPTTVYRMKKRDPEFAEQLKDCEPIIADRLEDTAFSYAEDSEYPMSAQMTMFLLKRFRNEYRENAQPTASYQDNRVYNISLNAGEEDKAKLDNIINGDSPFQLPGGKE